MTRLLNIKAFNLDFVAPRYLINHLIEERFLFIQPTFAGSGPVKKGIDRPLLYTIFEEKKKLQDALRQTVCSLLCGFPCHILPWSTKQVVWLPSWQSTAWKQGSWMNVVVLDIYISSYTHFGVCRGEMIKENKASIYSCFHLRLRGHKPQRETQTRCFHQSCCCLKNFRSASPPSSAICSVRSAYFCSK